MEIEMKPDFYNKTSTDKDGKTHTLDTSIPYLIYRFGISESYFFDVPYENKNDPKIQIELLDSILRDLDRSKILIEGLKQKAKARLAEHELTIDEK